MDQVLEFFQRLRDIQALVAWAGYVGLTAIIFAETGLLITELRQLTGTLNRVAQELEREPNALVLGRTPPPRGPGE